MLDQAYLNTGTCGPLPKQSIAAINQILTTELQQGRIGAIRFSQVRELLGQARSEIARLIGARPDQIALTGRTTDGLNIVLWGMRWQAGDEVITTRHEHAGLLVPLAALRQRYGVEIRYLSLDDFNPSAILARFEAALSRRTRLIAISHVLWTNGAVMPLAELTRMAHAAGARVLVDGAQSAGAIPVDVTASGVDFYALPGQKWLCGPEGTGGLYVSDDALAAVDPIYTGYSSVTSYDAGSPSFMPAPGARRFEVGVPFQPALAGLVASIRWLMDDVSPGAAITRITTLAEHVHRRLLDIPGVTVLTPWPPAGGPRSGLVSFNINSKEPTAVAAHLVQRGLIVRSIPEPYAAVRISTGFYNTEEELDRLVDEVARLAKQ